MAVITATCSIHTMGKKVLSQTTESLPSGSGGHRTQQEKVIYVDQDMGKWLFKKNNIVNEYLGALVGKNLGLHVPDIDVGYLQISENGRETKTPVVLHSYLNGATRLGDQPLPVAEKVALYCMGIFLGDSDFFGRENSNILRYRGQTFKIDCAQAFRQFARPGAVAQEAVNYIKEDLSTEEKSLAIRFFKELKPEKFEVLRTGYVNMMNFLGEEKIEQDCLKLLEPSSALGFSKIQTIDQLYERMSQELSLILKGIEEPSA